jgi:hypothetical protein
MKRDQFAKTGLGPPLRKSWWCGHLATICI